MILTLFLSQSCKTDASHLTSVAPTGEEPIIAPGHLFIAIYNLSNGVTQLKTQNKSASKTFKMNATWGTASERSMQNIGLNI